MKLFGVLDMDLLASKMLLKDALRYDVSMAVLSYSLGLNGSMGLRDADALFKMCYMQLSKFVV